MMRIKLSLILLLFTCVVSAQVTFTEYLTRQKAGEGKVTLFQDAEITALVNGMRQAPAQEVVNEEGEISATSQLPSGKATTVRVNGFRVQVYAGANTRQAKNEAYSMASRVRTDFPDVPVYTHFSSPRWICRAGNFRTYEEAYELLRQMHESGRFPEAAIVRSKINVTF